jgi:hypothetical protein
MANLRQQQICIIEQTENIVKLHSLVVFPVALVSDATAYSFAQPEMRGAEINPNWSEKRNDYVAGRRLAICRRSSGTKKGRIEGRKTTSTQRAREQVFDYIWSEWQDLNLRPPRPERGGAGWAPGL